MKLLTKLTLYSTISKAVIVLLFVLLLPAITERVAFTYTNYLLRQQEAKVLATIEKNGIDYYLDGDSSYGSYTMLLEEYISLERTNRFTSPDTVLTSKRMIEGDTLTYRLLTRNFEYDGKAYTLEIGKTLTSIARYNRPLQRIALYVLSILVVFTLLVDLGFTRVLLRPLKRIIRSKLDAPKYPYNEKLEPIATSTEDFRYLDNSLMDLMHRITEDFERERAFTSNASHELMTPLSMLQNKMENMLLATEDPVLLERVSGMMKTLGRLKKIVNALLLISRIENEQYAKTDACSMATILGDIQNEMSPLLEEKEIKCTLSVQSRVVHGINYDLLYQLFFNLITNAIRYNRVGGWIEIRAEYGLNGTYNIIIEDSGEGISAAELPHIFDRFKKSANKVANSNGLGLSIVKSIAHFHGIQINVDSVVGKGSRFSVIFPSAMTRQQ